MQKNPYCNSSESSHDHGKTAAAFIIRPEQRGKGLLEKLHKQREYNSFSIILNSNNNRKKKWKKERKINLAIAAANSGNKPRILTLVVEKLKTKKR